MYNLILPLVFFRVIFPGFLILSDVQEGEPSLEVTNEAQGAITEAQFAPNDHDLRVLEYKELSNICRDIYKEHLNSLLMLITVGAAILGYAISSKLTRRALICAAAVSLGLCWFALARHINYSRRVRAPMEYRLYNLERELGIKVWRTSRPLMVYMWKPPSSELPCADEIEASSVPGARTLSILLFVILVVSAICVIFLLVWAAFFHRTNAFTKPKTGESCSEPSNSF